MHNTFLLKISMNDDKNTCPVNKQDDNGVFTRSNKRPANFQQMYSKYTR